MSSAAVGDDNPQAGAGRPLPKKESDLFKNVVKHYEMKQYKKAIKQADAILRRFPNHGETLAMKGLTLNYMSKREEAHELVKEGLRNDMRYVQTILYEFMGCYWICQYIYMHCFFSWQPCCKNTFILSQIACLLACVWFTASFGS